MLNVAQLSKKYNETVVVDDVSFSLTERTCTALIGPNGAGKTTILRMITGLIKKTTGTIAYKDTQTDFRKLIGYLPQYPAFYNWMTGGEYLTYCARLTGMSKTEANKRSEQLLDQVGMLNAKNKRIGTYSGGMKQRLGIAQALIHDPALVILDEPVSALDPIGRREVLQLMEQLKQNKTILFSTHILNDADEISDGLIVLKNGKVVEKGTMEQLQQKYATEKIIIEVDDEVEVLQQAIDTLPSVKNSVIERSALHIFVSDIAIAREQILQQAMANNWPLTAFYVGKVTLEELFMKAVNE